MTSASAHIQSTLRQTADFVASAATWRDEQNITCRAHNMPWPAPTFGSHYSRFHRNRFIVGGVMAERLKAVLLPYRVFA